MKIIFSTGKGGVGKSTLAAAAAWQLSRIYRVLAVSLDPAHNLGDLFNVDTGGKRRRLTKNLHIEEIDLQKLSRQYLEREINVLSDTYKYLRALNLDNYFSVLKYSPGIEEYALLTGIENTIRDGGEYEFILFDTPPTGLTLRFLALPRITITWIDRLIEIRRKIIEKRYTIQKIRGDVRREIPGSGTVLAYDERDDAVLNRLRSLKDRYKNLTATLAGPDCSIFMVFNPDILSLKESQRLINGLRELELPLRLMIDNKVAAENRSMADEVEAALCKEGAAGNFLRVSLRPFFQAGSDACLYELEEDIASAVLSTFNEKTG